MKEYKAGIYLRLSKEDRESNNSIDFQREITTKYAKEHNYTIVKEYVDNGFSGILESRPALDKMIMDIVRKNINMVIVKDTSRLTRDKNLTSYYTDILFPDNDIRFISVTEYIDTGERYEIDDVVALRGIVNQCYVEDISKKVKAVKRSFKEQGHFIEGSVAYGYKKDKNDCHKLIIDEEVADNVRYIFKAYLDGNGPMQIANELNNRNIITASQYLKRKSIGKRWTPSMIKRILSSQIYAGNMVLNKYENNLRLKKKIANKVKDYKILENTHPAIISQEDFNKVQQKRSSRTKKERRTYYYLLKELPVCMHCGRKMTYKSYHPMTIDENGNIKGKQDNKAYFICEQHNRDREICNVYNKINETALNEIVLQKLSKRLKYLQLHQYAKDVNYLKEGQNKELTEIKKCKNEISKLETNFRILYEKKVEGIIREKDFKIKYKEYTEKVSKLKEKIDRFEEIKTAYNLRNDVERLIIEFENCNNFDNNIMKKLIEKIEIGKNNKIDITFKV